MKKLISYILNQNSWEKDTIVRWCDLRNRKVNSEKKSSNDLFSNVLFCDRNKLLYQSDVMEGRNFSVVWATHLTIVAWSRHYSLHLLCLLQNFAHLQVDFSLEGPFSRVRITESQCEGCFRVSLILGIKCKTALRNIPVERKTKSLYITYTVSHTFQIVKFTKTSFSRQICKCFFFFCVFFCDPDSKRTP